MADVKKQELALDELARMMNDSCTENEKFASLLSISQFVTRNSLDVKKQIQLYECLGQEFIVELLNAKDPPGCEEGTLLGIGLGILLCLTRERQIAGESIIISTISTLLAVITERHTVFDQGMNKPKSIVDVMREDAFHILIEIASSESGCVKILESDELEFLLDEMAKKNNNCLQFVHLLHCVMTKLSTDTLRKHKATFLKVFGIFTHRFLSHDTFTVKILQWVLHFLIFAKEKKIFDAFPIDMCIDCEEFVTLKSLQRGLMDMMQLKLEKDIRKLTIQVASILIEVFGICWIIKTEKSKEASDCNEKFLLLLTTLSSVEIGLYFDDTSDYEILSASFVVIENVIEYLCSNSCDVEQDQAVLYSSFDTQLVSAVSNAMQFIVSHLIGISASIQPEKACQDIEMIACIRILCAWLSKETLCMKEDIMKLAPILLKIGKASYFEYLKNSEQSEPVVFIFLLPALCHWSADENYRSFILKEQVHVTLASYMGQLFKNNLPGGHPTQSLETVVGILLNIAVTEWKFIADGDQTFLDVQQTIAENIQNYSKNCQSITLIANMVTLVLMLTRLQHVNMAENEITNSVFKCCFIFLYQSCPIWRDKSEMSKLASEKSQEVNELWLVGMDNLIACMPLYPELPNIMKNSIDWNCILHSTCQDYKSDFREVIVKLQRMYTKLNA